MSRNIFSNVDSKTKKRIKKIAIYAGAGAILIGGGIALGNGIGRSSVETMSVSDDTKLNSNSDINSSVVTESSVSSSVTESSTSTTESDILDSVEPSIRLTAEDVVVLSEKYAEYINKTATLKTEDYAFSEVETKDVIEFATLCNIDFISKEELARLIDKGLVSDNFHSIMQNKRLSYLFGIMASDTYTNAREGKTDMIDPSLILVDEKDKKVLQTLRQMMIDSSIATLEENKANYQHVVFYFGEDMQSYQGEYDYKTSPFGGDVSELSTGGQFMAGLYASIMDTVYNEKGATNKRYSQILNRNVTDVTNLINTFYDECAVLDDKQNETESQKTLTK